MSDDQTKSVESYLTDYAVLDGRGNMDGMFVPLSVALLAVELYAQGKLELNKPSHWGGSWPRTLRKP